MLSALRRRAAQDHGRFLSGREMLASQVLPTTAEFAKSCGAPQLELGEISDAQYGRMAGNSMSVPCVATVILAGVLALDMKA